MDPKAVSFKILKDLLSEYYKGAPLIIPEDLSAREVAVQPIDGEYYVRHLSFTDVQDLRRYLINVAPRHVYYSSAKYTEPGNPVMEEKGWLGSDLIFDIDANEIKQCVEEGLIVEFKYCPRCGYSSTAEEGTCPNCSAQLNKFEHVDVRCLRYAFEYLKRLVDVVNNELGLTELKASFSGNRGFHLIAEMEPFYNKIGSDLRREIASYIRLDESLKRALKETLTRRASKKVCPLPPRVTDAGLRRRVALELLNFIDDDKIRSYVLGTVDVLTIQDAEKVWQILQAHIDDILELISIPIDLKVTVDVSHLIRVPNSINGKTGWKALYLTSLDSFEPLPETLSPYPDLRLKIKFLIDVPRIFLLDAEFKFKRDDVKVLEFAYASYFIFKGAAVVIDVKR